eukprot:CAMPEP_0178916390 /NCGR_PEP_ID=MMETSP0786-20121207/12608_1 /TAXON_ID=186022 /ORGANISM="Thalassionema frauenfeldii, Strain CCMP 1798" /LENGTH=198 /DNA_ID=CAMNT_0020589711 /DNA_START=48 /DNA_END=644 /DNA_ORIENTATION=-
MTSEKKKLYLIRHAETIRNARIQGLRNLGGSCKQFKLPVKDDVKLGGEGIWGFLSGDTNSELSDHGKLQVVKLSKLLSEQKFLEKITKIGHSPLIRAEHTCDGILNGNEEVIKVKLDCLSEITPGEYALKFNRPVRRRICELGEWLDAQDDEAIALVGHSEYFRLLLNMREKFRNCDVWEVSYESDGVFSTPEMLYRI